jgi:hypothetical protein
MKHSEGLRTLHVSSPSHAETRKCFHDSGPGVFPRAGSDTILWKKGNKEAIETLLPSPGIWEESPEELQEEAVLMTECRDCFAQPYSQDGEPFSAGKVLFSEIRNSLSSSISKISL